MRIAWGFRFSSSRGRSYFLPVREWFYNKIMPILVRIGRYPSEKELIQDALRALLRAKPELKKDIAIELYQKNEVSLSRAAEICGLNIEDFKESLKEKGIKISVASVPVEELDKELERILEVV